MNGELSEGTFENTFVKQDGEWRIQSVHFYPRMIVEAATGWASRAKPAPGPSTDVPPDRPPTAVVRDLPHVRGRAFSLRQSGDWQATPVSGRGAGHAAGR